MEKKEQWDPKIIRINSMSMPVIRLADVREFIAFVEAKQPSELLWSRASNTVFKACSATEIASSIGDVAAIIIDGIAWGVQADAFHDYREMREGSSLGFETGVDYRDGQSSGIDSGEEYYLFHSSGFKDLQKFRSVMNSQIPDLFGCWLSNFEKFYPVQNIPQVSSLYEFYNEGVVEICGMAESPTKVIYQAWGEGFVFLEDYQDAHANGFLDATNYFEAQSLGVENAEIFAEMCELGVTAKTYWLKYEEIRKRIIDSGYSDAFGWLFRDFLNNQQPGTRLQIQVMASMLLKEVVNPCGLQAGSYVDFCRNMSIQAATEFICQHLELSGLITSSSEGVIQRRWYREDEKGVALIDVSNVLLHKDGEARGAEADVERLIALTSQLRSLGVSKLIGFADAPIRHQISDTELKRVRASLDKLQIAKGQEPADIYILDYVEKHPSIIVSNDQYRDWCNEYHPWRVENVNRLRLGFSFDEDGNVEFPHKATELQA